MAIQNISALPDAPTPADSPTDFATKAAAFVPAMTTFGDELNQFGVDVSNEVTSQVEAAQDVLQTTNYGLFDAIVVGDTDGVNQDFDILNASFYPYWMLFQDGVKIPLDEITISGTTVTLFTAPTSGAKMEAIAPRSTDFIAPTGYKTIALCSDKNSTIEMSCNVSGSVLPKWKVGGVTTESETFSYANSGEYIYIYLYVPDESRAVITAESQDIFLIDVQYNTDSVSQIKIMGNQDLSYYQSLANLTGLEYMQIAFQGNNMASFPLIDTSNVSNFFQAWFNNNLTSFPALDTSNVDTFINAWYQNSLVSFPYMDASNVTGFANAWRDNNLTSFPSLDYSSATDLTAAWYNNALAQEFVDQILTDLNNAALSNCVIGLDGGTNATPSAAGLLAKADLELRGCTVNVN